MESSWPSQGIRGTCEKVVSTGDGCKGKGIPGRLVLGLERRLWGGDRGCWLSRNRTKQQRP